MPGFQPRKSILMYRWKNLSRSTIRLIRKRKRVWKSRSLEVGESGSRGVWKSVDSKTSRPQDFWTQRLLDSKTSGLKDFWIQRLLDSKTSGFKERVCHSHSPVQLSFDS
jgi:hypothetical protein